MIFDPIEQIEERCLEDIEKYEELLKYNMNDALFYIEMCKSMTAVDERPKNIAYGI